jgi:hypothetical protein
MLKGELEDIQKKRRTDNKYIYIGIGVADWRAKQVITDTLSSAASTSVLTIANTIAIAFRRCQMRGMRGVTHRLTKPDLLGLAIRGSGCHAHRTPNPAGAPNAADEHQHEQAQKRW